jgi:OmpA-OmpF porin, OOP family
MSTFNLLDMAKGYLTNELVSKASGALGESEGGISKIISAAVPSLIGSIADKASTTDGAHAVAKMAADQHNSGLLGSLGNFFGGDDSSNNMQSGGGSIISSLLGGQGNMLTSLISNFAGVKSNSVGSILSMVAPAILGMIGKHSAENNVSASGLGSLMAGQKDLAMKALPGGFSLSSLMSGSTASVSNAASSVTNAASGAYNEVGEKAAGGMKWLLPLLLLGALAVGAWYYFKNKSADTATPKADTTGKKAGDVAMNPATPPKATIDSLTGLVNYDLGAMGDLELPGGIKINCAANGFENTLVNFIKNGTIDTVNKGANWFNLHDVQFVSGKTAYSTPKAMAQIKNVAAILKAYPKVVIKLGGNTDISGDAAANIALSQSRANQVMSDMKAAGAGATQISEAKGYGSEFATAKKGDKPGMAQDRKTTAKVASK